MAVSILRCALLTLILGLSLPANAMSSISFFESGVPFTGGTSGNGGSTFDLTFTLDAGTQDFDEAVIQIALLTYDNNFLVDVNLGEPGNLEEVPVDNNDPVAFSPAVNTPWTANGNGLARVIITLSQAGITFSASTSTSSTSMIDVIYPLATNTPVFVDGLNTIRIQNPNGPGPDGIDFTIIGSVPEPSTFALVSLGLVGLQALGRKRVHR